LNSRVDFLSADYLVRNKQWFSAASCRNFTAFFCRNCGLLWCPHYENT